MDLLDVSKHFTIETFPDRESQWDGHIRISFHSISAWNRHRDHSRPFWRILSIVQILDTHHQVHFQALNFCPTIHLKNVFKSNFRSRPSNFRSEKRSNWYLRRPKFQAQWHPCSKTDSSEVLISDFFWPAAANDIATIVITLSRIGEKDVNFFGIKWPEINIKLPLTHWKILENSSRNFLKFQFFWSRARPFYWKTHPDMDTVCVTPRIRKILFSTKSFVLNEFSRNRPV